ncbi:BRO-N domain-containing protein [Motilimonas cestriensis]|uniref:BRO-N domain-containing protein n=1 Tax=Motilimonas cestriensis TaxID=2742685 RepID=UPI003DA2403B
MSILLSFNNTQFNVVERDHKTWLTAPEIAIALGYKNSNAISRIFARNKDEFARSMSEEVKLTLSGNLQKTVRIFSLRGAHLVAMFSRTETARDFRKWVLDLLDRETQQHPALMPNKESQLPMLVDPLDQLNFMRQRWLVVVEKGEVTHKQMLTNDEYFMDRQHFINFFKEPDIAFTDIEQLTELSQAVNDRICKLARGG